MNIKRIRIKKLFNVFDHDISFNTKEKVTLIYGPNGIGKTIILTFIYSLFNSEYSWLRSLPFQEFLIEFDNKSTLKLSKEASNKSHSPEFLYSRSSNVKVEYKKENSRKPKTAEIKKLNLEEIRFLIHYIERDLPFLDRMDKDEWLDLRSGKMLEIDEILYTYADLLPNRFTENLDRDVPDWLNQLTKKMVVHLIDTNRLLKVSKANKRRRNYPESNLIPSVRMYSKELARSINLKWTEYATLSQSLDRSFPSRLMKIQVRRRPKIDSIKEELKKLELRRSTLIEAGLIDKEQDFQVDLEKIDNYNLNVLSIYIQDVNDKFSVFDELKDKIDLLRNIINSRFLYKKLDIDKTNGFVLLDSNNNKLFPEDLSSGEQHELVLFYELLFKVTSNSLILIDEPEISLHVEWQQQFLKDLLSIIKLADFKLFIATHSPQIIHDRWDLTVELKGKNN